MEKISWQYSFAHKYWEIKSVILQLFTNAKMREGKKHSSKFQDASDFRFHGGNMFDEQFKIVVKRKKNKTEDNDRPPRTSSVNAIIIAMHFTLEKLCNSGVLWRAGAFYQVRSPPWIHSRKRLGERRKGVLRSVLPLYVI